MKVETIAPFTMGGILHWPNEVIDVTPEKAESLIYQKLARQVKSIDNAPADKMVKSPVKTKSKGRKKK
jgi:hypothetical protein